MSYEKVKVIRVFETKDDNGERMHKVEVEFTRRFEIRFKRAEYLADLPRYEELAGKQALIPVRMGAFEGRAFMTFDGSATPVPCLPEPLKPSSGLPPGGGGQNSGQLVSNRSAASRSTGTS